MPYRPQIGFRREKKRKGNNLDIWGLVAIKERSPEGRGPLKCDEAVGRRSRARPGTRGNGLTIAINVIPRRKGKGSGITEVGQDVPPKGLPHWASN